MGEHKSKKVISLASSRENSRVSRSSISGALQSVALFGACGACRKGIKEHRRFEGEWLDKVPRMRMLCVTEEHDNLLMWAHYSKDHAGAVIKLRVMPEADNALCAAQPVIYHPSVPSPFSEQHLLSSIVGTATLALDEPCRNYARAKSDIWSYEKEWRLYDLAPSAEPPFFEYSGLKPNEIAAVYLGCRMADADKASIVDLVRRHHQTAAVFQASKAIKTYALEFARVL